jgi:hypothetical protein
MTKRDFFRLVIKLFGLYSAILSIFTFIPQNISNIHVFKDEMWVMFVVIGSVFLIAALFFVLLFKADFIIDKLDLDKGFDDDKIVFGDFNNEHIFKLAIIIIGGFLIVDYVPNFAFEVINMFKMRVSNNSIYGYEVNYFNLFTSITNIIIGLFFITNYKRISSFLDKK